MTALICGFAVTIGQAVPISETDSPGADYHWLHFDLTSEEVTASLSSLVPEMIAEALAAEETRPRLEVHPEGLLMTLRGVNLNPGAEAEDMVSLRLWTSPGLIVTARLRKLMAVDEIRKAMERGAAPESIANFLAQLCEGLTDRCDSLVQKLEDDADGFEDAMFANQLPGGEELASLRHKMLKLRRFLSPQRDALNKLSTLQHPLLDPEAKARLRETQNHAARHVEVLDANRERLTIIQDHLDSKQNDQLARTSYILSLVAAVFLPLSFITGVFGVNLAGMPGADGTLPFWWMILACIVIGAGLWTMMRWMRWF
ncbi:MAG: zinc transporter ZntB [Pseudomonadota bacterium]